MKHFLLIIKARIMLIKKDKRFGEIKEIKKEKFIYRLKKRRKKRSILLE
jgi:hypothetical protein